MRVFDGRVEGVVIVVEGVVLVVEGVVLVVEGVVEGVVLVSEGVVALGVEVMVARHRGVKKRTGLLRESR